MASTTPVKKPSTVEYIKLIAGPSVSIYVGTGNTEKHYELPKLLLCYYSKYFDRCFNGNFEESKTQTLSLPKDSSKDFELLIEYMLHGSMQGPIKFSETGKAAVARCIHFIEYADKYDLGVAGEAVYDILKEAIDVSRGLSKYAKVPDDLIESNYIQLIFRVTPDGSCLRTLIAQAALSSKGSKQCLSQFKKQMDEVHGFAAEILRIITSGATYRWRDPWIGIQEATRCSTVDALDLT